jgi:hypothetical protein
MSKKFYEFGRLVGGTNVDGSEIVTTTTPYGPGETFSGTLSSSTKTITFSNSTKHITIRNTHNSLFIEWSLNGTIWHSIGPYGEVKELISAQSILLKRSTSGNPTYEVVAVLIE